MASETPDGQQKTEEASGKRLGDARSRGQVAKSMDAVSAALLLFGGWIVFAFGASISSRVVVFMRYVLNQAHTFELSDASIPFYYGNLILFVASLLVPVLLLIMVIAVGIEVAQVGFHFATKKFSQGLNLATVFNPFKGLKRIFFSKQSYFELLKNFIKVSVLGVVVYQVLSSRTEIILSLMEMPFENMATFIAMTGFELVLKVGLVYSLIAVGDYIFQKRRFKQEMKMSKQEVKEENKQQEGDVTVKQRIRSIARGRLRKLMLKRVKEADVIITNPTHYAVALVYKQGTMSAPILVAKGVDFLALKIREIASEAKVPIVEDPPLARTLYASVDLDQEIPEQLFKAVAQVLAYVFKLKKKI